MNVLLIIEGTYPWYRGGVSEWVYQYLRNLDSISFSILQIATDEFGNQNPEQALYPLTDNIEDFERISPPDIDAGWSKESLTDWIESKKLGYLESLSRKCDVIHVTNTGFAGWLGATLSRKTARPLLLTEHAIYWKEIKQGAVALECGYKIPESTPDKAKVIESFKNLASFTYHTAHQVVTVSKYNIDYQKSLGARPVKYIPNGIPENWLQETKKRKENPVIGWVGRCAEMKNPLRFFTIAEAFSSSGISPEFIMMLSNANEKKLEEEVRKAAKLHPQVTLIWNQPARNYFKLFDFLFITSHNESQPLVMLEALAHKALPAGWQVGDLTHQYGLVFEAGTNVDVIASKVEDLWADQSLFQQMVEKRFKLVKSEHTWENIFSQYSRILNNMKEKGTRISVE